MLNSHQVTVNQIAKRLGLGSNYHHNTIDIGCDCAQFSAIVWPAHRRVAGFLRHNNTTIIRILFGVELPQDFVAGDQCWQIAALEAAENFALMFGIKGFNIQLLAVMTHDQAVHADTGGRIMGLLLVADAAALLLIESSFGHGRAFYYNGAQIQ